MDRKIRLPVAAVFAAAVVCAAAEPEESWHVQAVDAAELVGRVAPMKVGLLGRAVSPVVSLIESNFEEADDVNPEVTFVEEWVEEDGKPAKKATKSTKKAAAPKAKAKSAKKSSPKKAAKKASSKKSGSKKAAKKAIKKTKSKISKKAKKLAKVKKAIKKVNKKKKAVKKAAKKAAKKDAKKLKATKKAAKKGAKKGAKTSAKKGAKSTKKAVAKAVAKAAKKGGGAPSEAVVKALGKAMAKKGGLQALAKKKGPLKPNLHPVVHLKKDYKGKLHLPKNFHVPTKSQLAKKIKEATPPAIHTSKEYWKLKQLRTEYKYKKGYQKMREKMLRKQLRRHYASKLERDHMRRKIDTLRRKRALDEYGPGAHYKPFTWGEYDEPTNDSKMVKKVSTQAKHTKKQQVLKKQTKDASDGK